jgi:simple sugar transport system permease protein
MIEFLVSVLRSGSPLVYVAMAGMVAQRAGIWHLGLEGLMIAGACASVLGTVATGSLALGMLIAVIVCMLGSALLWFLIEKLRTNPIIAGLGITGLGLGGSDLTVQAIYESQASVHADIGQPRLGQESGPFATLTMLALLMPFIVALLWVIMRRTRFGLQVAAAGEHPFAARSVGVNPTRMRLIALLMGGVLCALAGTDLAMGGLQIFAIGMTAGRGFMGFAAVIFGASHPIYVALAALFFSAVENLGIKAQLMFGEAIPRHFVLMLPYFATIFGVWVSGRLRGGTQSLLGTTELRDY